MSEFQKDIVYIKMEMSPHDLYVSHRFLQGLTQKALKPSRHRPCGNKNRR